MCRRLLQLLIFLPLFCLVVPRTTADEDRNLPPLNQKVLDAVKAMPIGGGYSASKSANKGLLSAVGISGGILRVDPVLARPSYCSGATYLVFLKVLSVLQRDHQLRLSTETLTSLLPSGQPDGTGIWGRWNANGPGTARLFHELNLGRNFSDLSLALPGDFLKIFWNDGIGVSEHGHSVVYLGMETRNGMRLVQFWSSNIPGGYGERSVPISRIHRMIFSRLESPEQINLPLHHHTDTYLSSLQKRSSSPGEMALQCGLQP